MEAFSRTGGRSFPASDVKRPFKGHLRRPSFRVGGPNQPQPARRGQELTASSCETAELREAGKLCNLREEKRKRKKQNKTKAGFISEGSSQAKGFYQAVPLSVL